MFVKDLKANLLKTITKLYWFNEWPQILSFSQGHQYQTGRYNGAICISLTL